MLIRDAPGKGPALPELHRRVRWVVVVVVVAFAALIGRLWQLQVVRGEQYYDKTLENVVHERFLPSIRGRILDRRGRPLADNRPAFNIYLEPTRAGDDEREALARLLGLSDAERQVMRERIEDGHARGRGSPVLVFKNVDRDKASRVQQESFQLGGIEVRHEPYRTYPGGRLAAHLIGYMNQMTAAEYEKLAPQGYSASELIGRDGLERAWEEYLRGIKGVERYAVNARGQRIPDAEARHLIDGDPIVEPVGGRNLILTLDVDLQRVAERAVRRHAAAAIAVVEVGSGRVLALVSKPAFDSNVMTGNLTRAEEALMRQDPRKPFIDKTLEQHYPPGSTYKFVVALAALADGVADPAEKLVCPGQHTVGRHRFGCTSRHGPVDLEEALKHSCNVYFWKLAERVGMDRMAEVAREYGLGAPTGLGLNGDVAGRVPTRAWYEQRTAFKIGYTINAATGQGDVEVTPLQMAMAYAALATGTLYVPQVVDRIETASGRTVVAYEPRVRRAMSTSPAHRALMHAGMWRAVNEPGGTAHDYARSEQVAFAGKTGTAEVRGRRKRAQEQRRQGWHPERSHAWFAGYAPAESPEIAIVVLIEHGGQGGKVAAPVAREIIEGYFADIAPAARGAR